MNKKKKKKKKKKKNATPRCRPPCQLTIQCNIQCSANLMQCNPPNDKCRNKMKPHSLSSGPAQLSCPWQTNIRHIVYRVYRVLMLRRRLQPPTQIYQRGCLYKDTGPCGTELTDSRIRIRNRERSSRLLVRVEFHVHPYSIVCAAGSYSCRRECISHCCM